MENKIRMHGTCTRAAYIELLKQSSVLLFPSLHEPGAYVVIEAMSAAKPIICMALGEPATLVGTTGIQIPCDHSESSLDAMEKALHSLYTNTPLAHTLGLAGRRRVEEHFLWDRRATEISAVYREITSASSLSEGHGYLHKGVFFEPGPIT
jgi:glycosyltransferase involved in cell wall biosynthesis